LILLTTILRYITFISSLIASIFLGTNNSIYPFSVAVSSAPEKQMNLIYIGPGRRVVRNPAQFRCEGADLPRSHEVRC
jgi:hypothetical protein